MLLKVALNTTNKRKPYVILYHLHTKINVHVKCLIKLLFYYFVVEYCPESTGYTYKPSTSICFKFNKAYVNYTQAESLCTSEGVTLIRIDSVEKLNEVYYHLIGEFCFINVISSLQSKAYEVTVLLSYLSNDNIWQKSSIIKVKNIWGNQRDNKKL